MEPHDFDWRTYLILNPDVAKHQCTKKFALYHWKHFGHKEKRVYKSLEINFDWKFYTSYYPDLRHLTTEESALQHYIWQGICENRLINPLYKSNTNTNTNTNTNANTNTNTNANTNTNRNRNRNTNTKVILFTNARDEENLEEWVAYHLLIGFDEIIIFDHVSKIPISSIFQKYNFPQLEIHRDNSEKTDKHTFMLRAYNISKTKQATWMLYMDSDEYLVLRIHHNIHNFIQDYNNFHAIGINWIMFGSNYLDSNPSLYLIDNFTRCSYNDKANCHVKTLVQVNSINISNPVQNPHYWMLKHDLSMYTTHKTHMPIGPFNLLTQGIHDPAYIHHYHFQSYNSYIRRKVQRIQDDKTSPRPFLSKHDFHLMCNQNTETYLRDNYSNKIKQFLQEHLVESSKIMNIINTDILEKHDNTTDIRHEKQDSVIDINQGEHDNITNVSKEKKNNVIDINQEKHDNATDINQEKHNNDTDINQEKHNNDTDINQENRITS